MNAAATIALSAYAIGLGFLGYLFCYGDPGTLGGLLPFLAIAGAVPLTATLTFSITARRTA